jgi:biopolymer transport protein ExbD
MRIPLPVTRKRARIEIIPLIDIVFFLLAIFVMVSLSMVKNQGIAINLPSAKTAAQEEPSTQVTITIAQDGQVYLDQAPVRFEDLPARLKQLRRSDPNLKIIINGDDQADFGRAIGTLDEVRRAGINKVSIRTKGQTAHPGE